MKPSERADWQTVKRAKEQDREALVAAFNACGGSANGSNTVRCIVHDDGGKPNGSIAQAEGGKWYFKCYKCSDVCLDVWDLEARAAGVATQEHLAREKARFSGAELPADYVPRAIERIEQGRPIASQKQRSFKTAQDASDFFIKVKAGAEEPSELVLEKAYPYFCDASRQFTDYIVFRYQDKTTGAKTFYQCHQRWYDDNLWYSGMPTAEMLAESGGRLPLFNRKRIADAERIVFVEGEKSVEAFHLLAHENEALASFACVTSPMGAGKDGIWVAKTFFAECAGKEVWLFEDNDASGAVYMQKVFDELQKLEPVPRIYKVRTKDLRVGEEKEQIVLPPKGDLYDFLEIFETREDKTSSLLEVLLDADLLDRTTEYGEELDAIIDGEMRLINFSRHPQLSNLTQALLPGTITLFCGDPGSRKSWFLLEQAWRLKQEGSSVAILMLEEDTRFWQRRANAQMAGLIGMTNFEWIKTNPDQTRRAYRDFRTHLDDFTSVLHCPENIPTLTAVSDWIIGEIKKGTEVIIVDPVTAAIAEKKEIWQEDQEFLFRVKMALKGSRKSRVFIVTHPRTEQLKTGKPSLAGLAGGQAYPRFSQCILWLRIYNPAESADIDAGGGNTLFNAPYFNSLEILKSRSGPGAGRGVATDFDPASGCFTELGVVTERDD